MPYPYNRDRRGKETALPYPHHSGTAGIDINPLAGKSKLGVAEFRYDSLAIAIPKI